MGVDRGKCIEVQRGKKKKERKGVGWRTTQHTVHDVFCVSNTGQGDRINYLVLMSKLEYTRLYSRSSFIFKFCLSMFREVQDVISVDPCHKFTWCLDACIRLKIQCFLFLVALSLPPWFF